MSAGADNALKQWLFNAGDGAARLLRFRSGHAAPPAVVRFYGDTGTRLLSAGANPGNGFRSKKVAMSFQDLAGLSRGLPRCAPGDALQVQAAGCEFSARHSRVLQPCMLLVLWPNRTCGPEQIMLPGCWQARTAPSACSRSSRTRRALS